VVPPAPSEPPVPVAPPPPAVPPIPTRPPEPFPPVDIVVPPEPPLAPVLEEPEFEHAAPTSKAASQTRAGNSSRARFVFIARAVERPASFRAQPSLDRCRQPASPSRQQAGGPGVAIDTDQGVSVSAHEIVTTTVASRQ
jgi:hypothetical protein